MMALTHGFMALATAVLLLPAVGEYGGPALLAAAFLGGLAPDADLVARHRKTLHFPVWFSVATLVLSALAVLTGSGALLVLTVAVGAAALHSLSDVLGGSAEREPWNPVTENGVYNHVLGRWHRPRRYVRYSGAPEDFLVCLAFAAVAIKSGLTGPAVDRVLFGLVAFAGGYSLCRKRLATIGAVAGGLVPTRLRAALPAVSVEETETDGTTVNIRFGR
ncbi:metal-dependent hydrolase [Haloterrigena salifodinae]|uniref:Metal-dependent hydrolase n=1 Tax=Haloterrigena salifodinae TaxID=2675099 RepID=A0A8T8DWH5_9EURY|nr:metal-dependent hydrolase [Haloterrigena salifodinae]QRV13672.1 metal-dependent hydrolase [Haloterrigena salifodinae]